MEGKKKERNEGRKVGRILNYYRIIKTKNERRDGREREREEGKEGRKKAKNEEIWGLEEDTSRWPPLSLLVHGSLQ